MVARFALFTREIAGVLHLAQSSQRISTGFGTAIAIFGAVVALFGGYRYVIADRALLEGKSVSMTPAVAVFSALFVAIVGTAVGAGLAFFR